jgi:hypothetical protein
MATPRFAYHSDADIETNKWDITPKKIKNSNETSAKTFRAYLSEKKLDKLKHLRLRFSEIQPHFYLDVRTEGKMYKTNSLESLKHGLNRYIKSPPHSKKFDIIKDMAFNEANESFKLAMKEIPLALKIHVHVLYWTVLKCIVKDCIVWICSGIRKLLNVSMVRKNWMQPPFWFVFRLIT